MELKNCDTEFTWSSVLDKEKDALVITGHYENRKYSASISWESLMSMLSSAMYDEVIQLTRDEIRRALKKGFQDVK